MPSKSRGERSERLSDGNQSCRELGGICASSAMRRVVKAALPPRAISEARHQTQPSPERARRSSG